MDKEKSISLSPEGEEIGDDSSAAEGGGGTAGESLPPLGFDCPEQKDAFVFGDDTTAIIISVFEELRSVAQLLQLRGEGGEGEGSYSQVSKECTPILNAMEKSKRHPSDERGSSVFWGRPLPTMINRRTRSRSSISSMRATSRARIDTHNEEKEQDTHNEEKEQETEQENGEESDDERDENAAEELKYAHALCRDLEDDFEDSDV